MVKARSVLVPLKCRHNKVEGDVQLKKKKKKKRRGRRLRGLQERLHSVGFFSTSHIMRNCSVCVSSCALNVTGGGGPLKGPCGPPTHAETKHVRNKEKHAAYQPAFRDWEPVFSLAPSVLGARTRSSCETGPLIAALAPFY